MEIYRTLESIASLGDLAGTSVVLPSVGISQGSEGNPTSVNILPALNVGHIVASFFYSFIVSTGHLSVPGVTIYPTEYVSKAYLNSALWTVTDLFKTRIQSLIKGKGIALPAESSPLVPPVPQEKIYLWTN